MLCVKWRFELGVVAVVVFGLVGLGWCESLWSLWVCWFICSVCHYLQCLSLIMKILSKWAYATIFLLYFPLFFAFLYISMDSYSTLTFFVKNSLFICRSIHLMLGFFLELFDLIVCELWKFIYEFIFQAEIWNFFKFFSFSYFLGQFKIFEWRWLVIQKIMFNIVILHSFCLIFIILRLQKNILIN